MHAVIERQQVYSLPFLEPPSVAPHRLRGAFSYCETSAVQVDEDDDDKVEYVEAAAGPVRVRAAANRTGRFPRGLTNKRVLSQHRCR
jgi:hypothetical protein